MEEGAVVGTKESPVVNTPVPPAPVGDSKLLSWGERETPAPPATSGGVVACVNRSPLDQRVVVHAELLARALHCPLVLAQVLEPVSYLEGPQDPLTWGIRRHRCRERFSWLASHYPIDPKPQQVLLEGRPAEQLCNWVVEHHGTFLAFATHCDLRRQVGLGATAQRLVETAPASLLLVPPSADETPRYDRILVPLDGSCRAESVLSTVASLAGGTNAEVTVVHIVPQPEFTEVGPLEAEAIDLRDRLNQRNEQVARTYLERVLLYLQSRGLRAHPLILRGDVRRRLQQVFADQRPDLVVVASHGRTGRADVPCGSVTSYLADHAVTPLLILRDKAGFGGDALALSQSDYCPLPLHP
jgi:nucleotide-binding universal stress UspA family protein